MAVRCLVNLERLTTAHVNSIDGSMTYESGVEYKANTTVSYNGSLYTANVDIEDTDTDTPDIAPDRWSLTINASEAGTSGDISALAARVTALEETVGDETGGLVKDVSDIITGLTDAGYGVSGFGLASVTSDGVKTYQDICTELATALLNVCQSLEDDEMLIQLYASLSGIGSFIIHQVPYNNTTTGLAVSGICTAITSTTSTYANVYMSNNAGASHLNTIGFDSVGMSFSNKDSTATPASTSSNFVMYLKLKKLVISE